LAFGRSTPQRTPHCGPLANRGYDLRLIQDYLGHRDPKHTMHYTRVALVESAEAAGRTKGTYLAAQYARLKGRHGHKKAVFAVAHSILVIAYHLLQRNQPYDELGGDYFIERQSKDAYQRRLIKQLERMGYNVALTERAA
jgi:transposase